jgi:hypothetical protein
MLEVLEKLPYFASLIIWISTSTPGNDITEHELLGNNHE